MINVWQKDDDRIPVSNESGCWRTSCGRDFENSSLSLSRNLQTYKIVLSYPLSHRLPPPPPHTNTTPFPSKGASNLNPVPYNAAYMGEKVHNDQNEKLVGVTHIVAVDKFSSKIVARATMPVKNNLTIYESVYRLVQCFCMLSYFA